MFNRIRWNICLAIIIGGYQGHYTSKLVRLRKMSEDRGRDQKSHYQRIPNRQLILILLFLSIFNYWGGTKSYKGQLARRWKLVATDNTDMNWCTAPDKYIIYITFPAFSSSNDLNESRSLSLKVEVH